MAKKPATPAPVEETALAPAAAVQAIAERPSFIAEGDLTGTEGITREDLRLPLLTLAQGLSEQLIEDSSSYIPNLKMFDFFNDLTNEIYGKGPLTFIVLRRDARNIEFRPREEGGGVLDLDVPPGDKRLKWTKDEATGERKPPAATHFVEFVVLLMHPNAKPEPIVLSIKDTNKFNRKAHQRLSGFIKIGNAPIYAKIYTVTSKTEKNDSGTFAVPMVNQLGFIQDEALYRQVEALSKAWADKKIDVNREPGGDDDFDPAELEREGAAERPAM